MKRKRRINFADVWLTIVVSNPTKANPNRRMQEELHLEQQVVIGDTAIEAMECYKQQAFLMDLRGEYDSKSKQILVCRIDFVQVRHNMGKTQYLI
jgi:hypothetical protein